MRMRINPGPSDKSLLVFFFFFGSLRAHNYYCFRRLIIRPAGNEKKYANSVQRYQRLRTPFRKKKLRARKASAKKRSYRSTIPNLLCCAVCTRLETKATGRVFRRWNFFTRP